MDKQFYICNELDKPSEESICYKHGDSLVYVKNNEISLDRYGGIPIILFGFDVERVGDVYKFTKVRKSTAVSSKMRDPMEHIAWEGSHEFELTINKGA